MTEPYSPGDQDFIEFKGSVPVRYCQGETDVTSRIMNKDEPFIVISTIETRDNHRFEHLIVTPHDVGWVFHAGN